MGLTGSQIERKPNRLIDEKSPYLLQHSYNPVDWHAWNEGAFEAARREDKPVFLSIGYSTCHWCHVMEHESFEDTAVARLMNDAFVCIKVDREERPDIDNIYMTVCQQMTGSGGWPLTIIMTPDKKPFFAATYIPKESMHGRMGLMELVPRVAELWHSDRERLLGTTERVLDALAQQDASAYGGSELGLTTLNAAYDALKGSFDDRNGGFEGQRKFPMPHNFLFLLRYYKRTGEPHALEIVEKTLQAMRRGGIYDHVGYGFHRYSTDPYWLLPHFEKMLYDQALMCFALIETYQVTHDEQYARNAREILEYIRRDMTDADGGFYSAEDADSEGEEGKFYVWSSDEIREILGDDYEFFARCLNISPEGNFQEESTGLPTGQNILHLDEQITELAEREGMTEEDLRERINSLGDRLFKVRNKRVPPAKDDKILTDWSGLMIAAFACAAQVLGDESYSACAKKAADFVLENMRREDGRLLHRYRDGEAAIDGYLDDYAFFTWALIELYETIFEVGYLKAAIDLQEMMVEHFWDDNAGGFFFAADDGEKLIHRSKEAYDGAVPSGNSVAMWNLIRLSRITGNAEYDKKSSILASALSGVVSQLPANHTLMMCALDFAIGPSYELVISGDAGAESTRRMIETSRSIFSPNMVTIFRPDGDKAQSIIELAGYTRDQVPLDGTATAYVCMNHSCRLPTTDPSEMLRLLTE